MNAIEMDRVCKKYSGFNINNITLNIPEGSVMGLIGENGSGKTTLLKLVLNSAFKDSGKIEVLGAKQDSEFYKIKDDIGVVLDTPVFNSYFKVSEIESVMSKIFRNWDRKEFYEYIDRFSIPKNTKFKAMSKGNKMKLSIACALSHKAKLLILDEPVNGLDPVAREDFLEILWDFTRDESHSVLISSHIVSDLEKICDYITFIHNGEIILSSEKDELINKFGIADISNENFESLEKSTVAGSRKNPYGVEALVRKENCKDLKTRPASLEEIFVYMIKGER